jgi:hypothetical protein
MKYFRLSWEDILWNVSYVNLNMLIMTIPKYEGIKDKEETQVVDGIDELKMIFE